MAGTQARSGGGSQCAGRDPSPARLAPQLALGRTPASPAYGGGAWDDEASAKRAAHSPLSTGRARESLVELPTAPSAMSSDGGGPASPHSVDERLAHRISSGGTQGWEEREKAAEGALQALPAFRHFLVPRTSSAVVLAVGTVLAGGEFGVLSVRCISEDAGDAAGSTSQFAAKTQRKLEGCFALLRNMAPEGFARLKDVWVTVDAFVPRPRGTLPSSRSTGPVLLAEAVRLFSRPPAEGADSHPSLVHPVLESAVDVIVQHLTRAAGGAGAGGSNGGGDGGGGGVDDDDDDDNSVLGSLMRDGVVARVRIPPEHLPGAWAAGGVIAAYERSKRGSSPRLVLIRDPRPASHKCTNILSDPSSAGDDDGAEGARTDRFRARIDACAATTVGSLVTASGAPIPASGSWSMHDIVGTDGARYRFLLVGATPAQGRARSDAEPAHPPPEVLERTEVAVARASGRRGGRGGGGLSGRRSSPIASSSRSKSPLEWKAGVVGASLGAKSGAWRAHVRLDVVDPAARNVVAKEPVMLAAILGTGAGSARARAVRDGVLRWLEAHPGLWLTQADVRALRAAVRAQAAEEQRRRAHRPTAAASGGEGEEEGAEEDGEEGGEHGDLAAMSSSVSLFADGAVAPRASEDELAVLMAPVAAEVGASGGAAMLVPEPVSPASMSPLQVPDRALQDRIQALEAALEDERQAHKLADEEKARASRELDSVLSGKAQRSALLQRAQFAVQPLLADAGRDMDCQLLVWQVLDCEHGALTTSTDAASTTIVTSPDSTGSSLRVDAVFAAPYVPAPVAAADEFASPDTAAELAEIMANLWGGDAERDRQAVTAWFELEEEGDAGAGAAADADGTETEKRSTPPRFAAVAAPTGEPSQPPASPHPPRTRRGPPAVATATSHIPQHLIRHGVAAAAATLARALRMRLMRGEQVSERHERAAQVPQPMFVHRSFVAAVLVKGDSERWKLEPVDGLESSMAAWVPAECLCFSSLPFLRFAWDTFVHSHSEAVQSWADHMLGDPDDAAAPTNDLGRSWAAEYARARPNDPREDEEEGTVWQTFSKAGVREGRETLHIYVQIRQAARPSSSASASSSPPPVVGFSEALESTPDLLRLIIVPTGGGGGGGAARVLPCTYEELMGSPSAFLKEAAKLVPAVFALSQQYRSPTLGSSSSSPPPARPTSLDSPDTPHVPHDSEDGFPVVHRIGDVVATLIAAKHFRRALRNRKT